MDSNRIKSFIATDIPGAVLQSSLWIGQEQENDQKSFRSIEIPGLTLKTNLGPSPSWPEQDRHYEIKNLTDAFNVSFDANLIPKVQYLSKTALLTQVVREGSLEEVEDTAPGSPFDFGTIIYAAGQRGDVDILEYLLYAPAVGPFTSLLPRTSKVYLNTALQGAALGDDETGNYEAVSYLLDKGAEARVGLYNAAKSHNLTLIHFLLQALCNSDLNEEMILLLNAAAEGGAVEVVSYVLKAANFSGEVLSQSLFFASKGKNDLIIQMILDKANVYRTNYSSPLNPELPVLNNSNPEGNPNQNTDDMNWAIKGLASAETNDASDVERVYDYLSRGGDDITNALFVAIKAHDQEAASDFISRGADNWDDALAAITTTINPSLTGSRDVIYQYLPPNHRIANYQPAMSVAINRGDIETLNLLAYYPDENDYVSLADNLINVAIDADAYDALVYLLESESHYLSQRQYQDRLNDALAYAAGKGRAEWVSRFLQAGAQSNPDLVVTARSAGFVDVAALL